MARKRSRPRRVASSPPSEKALPFGSRTTSLGKVALPPMCLQGQVALIPIALQGLQLPWIIDIASAEFDALNRSVGESPDIFDLDVDDPGFEPLIPGGF